MEAKHLQQAFSPLEMAIHIAEFHGPNALAIEPGTNEFRQFRSAKQQPYVQRILRNADAIRNNTKGGLQLINTNSRGMERDITLIDNGDWQVIELAVTSHTEIAAFVSEPALPFVAIDHLQDIFMADDRPPSGWWTPRQHEHA